ncbi:MAG TPA: SRPBCC domain-containing protein, partial [Microbacterium sp.]|nr:SRPBCC domain-containing protein [Microbacterium sp.]
MTAKATGHYTLKPDGLYLQFDRLFHAPIEEVWFSLTNPTAMQSWIGTYTGRPETGGVRFRMGFEGDEGEWQNVSILECGPPY